MSQALTLSVPVESRSQPDQQVTVTVGDSTDFVGVTSRVVGRTMSRSTGESCGETQNLDKAGKIDEAIDLWKVEIRQIVASREYFCGKFGDSVSLLTTGGEGELPVKSTGILDFLRALTRVLWRELLQRDLISLEIEVSPKDWHPNLEVTLAPKSSESFLTLDSSMGDGTEEFRHLRALTGEAGEYPIWPEFQSQWIESPDEDSFGRSPYLESILGELQSWVNDDDWLLSLTEEEQSDDTYLRLMDEVQIELEEQYDEDWHV